MSVPVSLFVCLSLPVSLSVSLSFPLSLSLLICHTRIRRLYEHLLVLKSCIQTRVTTIVIRADPEIVGHVVDGLTNVYWNRWGEKLVKALL